MMNKIAKRSLLLILSLCFVLSLGYFALFSPVKVQRVDAADNTFEMLEGASIKTNGDGLRWIVKMSESVRNNIVNKSNVTLSFLIAPKSFFAGHKDDYINLSKYVQITVPNYNIYTTGGYFYANAVLTNLDPNNRSSGSGSAQYNLDFVAVAMITDSSAGTYSYASFAVDGSDYSDTLNKNARTQYNVLQDAIANEDIDTAVALLNTTTSPYKNWFGSGDYKWQVNTEARYTRYNVLVPYSGIGTLSDRSTVSDDNLSKVLKDAQAKDTKGFAFYDTPLSLVEFEDGKKQTICYEGDPLKPEISYTTAKHVEGEVGSTKLAFNINAAKTSMRWYPFRGMAYIGNWLATNLYSESKYVVFYVYFEPSDSTTDYIDMALLDSHRVRVDKGQWTMVLWRGKEVYEAMYWRTPDRDYFYSYYYGGKYDENEANGYKAAAIKGNVYLSRARILDASEIYQLTNSDVEGGFTVGNTKFSKAYSVTNGSYNQDSTNFNNTGDAYGKAFYVDGNVYFHALSNDSSTPVIPKLTFSLYDITAKTIANTVLYVTMNIPSTVFTTIKATYCYYDTEEHGVGSWNGVVDKVLDNGFTRYAFMTKSNWAGNLEYFYLTFDGLAKPYQRGIVISDIEIDTTEQASYEVREAYASTTDADVLGMFDNVAGVSQIGFYGSIDESGTPSEASEKATAINRLAVTTDKHIAGQSASLKVGWGWWEKDGEQVEPDTEGAIQKGAWFWTGIKIDPANYSLERGKYVVFYVYNDVGTRTDSAAFTPSDIDLYVGPKDSWKKVCALTNGAWTMVSIKSDDLIDGGYKLCFLPQEETISGFGVYGDVYISRMEVYSAKVFALLDTKQGVTQVVGTHGKPGSWNALTVAYDTTEHMSGEAGSLKIEIPADYGAAYPYDGYAYTGHIKISLPNGEARPTTGYLAFYVKNDTQLGATVMLGGKSRVVTKCTIAAKSNWTLVCLPMSDNNKENVDYANCVCFFMSNFVTDANKGNIYVSRMMIYDTEVVGMFDSKIGTAQVTSVANGQPYTKSFVKNYHIEGENGSLRIRYKNATVSYENNEGNTIYPCAFKITMPGYTLASGKYVVFYVYNATNASYIDLALDTTNRVRLRRGVWTMIVYNSDAVNTANFIERFFVNSEAFDGGDTTLTGDIYFSRVKVYSADDVKAANTSGTYAIGNTTFSQIGYANQGTMLDNVTEFIGSTPYYVDGILKTLILPAKDNTTTNPVVRMTLNESYDPTATTVMYITMKGAETTYGYVQAQIFCGDSADYGAAGVQKGTVTATRSEDIGDGYFVYRFDLSGFASYNKMFGIGLFTTRGESPQFKQVLISDVTFVNKG